MDNNLPPLPESDPKSLQRNRFHGYYQIGAKEFWNGANISSHKLEEFKKCQHYFMRERDEVRCNKCYAGWEAPDIIQVQNGQLIVYGQVQLIL